MACRLLVGAPCTTLLFLVEESKVDREQAVDRNDPCMNRLTLFLHLSLLMLFRVQDRCRGTVTLRNTRSPIRKRSTSEGYRRVCSAPHR